MPPRRAYSETEIDAAVERLTEPDRLEQAQRIVGHSAPQLQRILNQALDEGEWFGPAHQESVRRAAMLDDDEERQRAVRTLIAEETRVAMLVGVAVGIELAHLLIENNEPGET